MKTLKMKRGKIVPYKCDAEFFYKIGIKYADRGDFVAARKFLERAASMERYHPDYLFNLACILSELKEIDKSNRLLLDILKNIDPTYTECYFGIACNYFDTGNLRRAKEYFEKYIFNDKEGQFIDEACEALYYLQIYDDVNPKKMSKLVSKLVVDGTKLMEEGKYKEAAFKFERAIDIDPKSKNSRKALALCMFYLGEIPMAISLAKSILTLDPQDITANLYLLFFYSISKSRSTYVKQLRAVTRLGIRGENDLCLVIDTCLQFKDYTILESILSGYMVHMDGAGNTLQNILDKDGLNQKVKGVLKRVLKKDICQMNVVREKNSSIQTTRYGRKHIKNLSR